LVMVRIEVTGKVRKPEPFRNDLFIYSSVG
jgi:hypothetical protein